MNLTEIISSIIENNASFIVNEKYRCIPVSTFSAELKNENCNSYSSQMDVLIYDEDECTQLNGYILKMKNKDLLYSYLTYSLVMLDSNDNCSRITTITSSKL